MTTARKVGQDLDRNWKCIIFNLKKMLDVKYSTILNVTAYDENKTCYLAKKKKNCIFQN